MRVEDFILIGENASFRRASVRLSNSSSFRHSPHRPSY